MNLVDPDGLMGRLPDIKKVYDATSCARYQKMYLDALKGCEKECGTSDEDEIKYLDKYGPYMSTANLNCVCQRMKLSGKNCAEVFKNCGLTISIPVGKPTR